MYMRILLKKYYDIHNKLLIVSIFMLLKFKLKNCSNYAAYMNKNA